MEVMNLTLILFLSLILPLLLHRCLFKRSNLPPGPTPLPIIGSLLELGDFPHRSLARLAKSHGPIMTLKLGQVTTTVISSPHAAKQVLQTHDSVFSSRAPPHAIDALGHRHVSMVWMPPTPQWKHLRTILKAHLFSTQQLDTKQSLRRKKVEELVEHVRGRMGQKVDVGRAALCTMMNELSNLFFSMDMVDINSETVEEFAELIRGVMEEAGNPNISDLFPAIRILDVQGRKRRVEEHFTKCTRSLMP